MKKIEASVIGIIAVIGIVLLVISGAVKWKSYFNKTGELVQAAEMQLEEKGTTADYEGILYTEVESESESEMMGETEVENESEEAAETASEQQSEDTSEAETSDEDEEATEEVSEAVTETASERQSEDTSEAETSDEDEEATEEVSEAVTETVSERQSDDTSEAETSSESEAATEIASEQQSEETSEAEPSSEDEAVTETVSESEIISETEMNTEREEIKETEAENSQLLPVKIERGKHYDVKGESGAWYRDKQDRLWVRKGTNLYIETKQEGGFDSRGIGMQNLQNDGVMTFQLQKADDSGVVMAMSEVKQEQFYVDGEVPEANVIVDGNEENGVIHTAQWAQIRIQIPPDGKSGMKNAEYCVVNCKEDGTLLQNPEEMDWHSCENGQSISVETEGNFRIYVRTQDQVGNQEFAQSRIVCVDRTPPELSVEGVQDQTANSDAVQIKVSCKDQHYQKGSLKIQITASNEGRSPAVKEQEESEQGASVTYLDFPVSKTYDDVYKLNVTASDLSGNQSEQTLTFSVNRFGSVYDLSEDTKKGLEQYYLKQPQAITFYETNIDYVGESQIFCRRDGEVVQLQRGSDYHVAMQGSHNSWKQYQYEIPASYFKKEGIYELQLSSTDQAKNESDTGIQGKQVVFVLDWTAPTCTITGVKAGEIYDRENLTVYLIPQDNFNLASMKIYADSELIQEQKTENQKAVKLTFEAKTQWQTLQVYLCDYSGNEYWSEEIPFYIRNDETEVAPYEKIRESAEEKEKRAKLEKMSFLSGFTFTLAHQPELLPISDKQVKMQDEAPELATEEIKEPEIVMQEEEEYAAELWFLFVGAGVFLLTVLVLLVDIFRQLWYDAP